MPAPQNLFKTVIHALISSMGLRMAAMALRFITICLLPFWLSAEEIGFTALILIIVNITIALVDLGLGTALIHEKNVSSQMYTSVYTATAILSAFFALAVILLANPIETAIGLPAVLTVIAAFAIPFNGFAIIPNTMLQRDLRFTSLAVRDLIGEAAFSIAAITLAWQGFGAFAVAAAVVFQRIIRWCVASFSVSWKPRLKIVWSDIRTLFSFSAYQFCSLLLAQLFNQIDKILLAVFLTPTALGFYSQAQQFTLAPVQSLTGTANNVFFTAFSKVQNDDATLQQLLIKVLRGLTLLSGIAVGLIAPALLLVPLVYTPEWRACVPAALFMAASIPIFCAYIFEGIMIAIGGEKRRVLSVSAKLAALVTFCFAAFALFPNFDGKILMAAAMAAAMLVSVIMNAGFIFKRLNITPHTLRPVIKPALLGLFIAAVALFVSIFILQFDT